jgi:hypothetical protein
LIEDLVRAVLQASGGESKVSLSDIEDRLRQLSGGAREAIAESKQSALAIGTLGGIGLLAATYLLGRRRGRRRATVLEVRRA